MILILDTPLVLLIKLEMVPTYAMVVDHLSQHAVDVQWVVLFINTIVAGQHRFQLNDQLKIQHSQQILQQIDQQRILHFQLHQQHEDHRYQHQLQHQDH